MSVHVRSTVKRETAWWRPCEPQMINSDSNGNSPPYSVLRSYCLSLALKIDLVLFLHRCDCFPIDNQLLPTYGVLVSSLALLKSFPCYPIRLFRKRNVYQLPVQREVLRNHSGRQELSSTRYCVD
jgi:hypothetical protein